MFGERLNETRKLRGFTAQQMADTLCIALRTYRNYENEGSYPDFDKLVKIADKIDVSIDYLLCRDEFIQSHATSFDGH